VAALTVISNDDLGWEDWNRIGMAIWRATDGGDQGFWAFDQWSRKSTKYNEANTRDSWYRKYRSCPPSRIGAGTIFYSADLASPGWRVEYDAKIFKRLYRESESAAGPSTDTARDNENATTSEVEPDRLDETGKPTTPDKNEIAPAFSEQALALLFAAAHTDELRYVAAWGKWLIYDGVKWKFDDTRKAWTFAGRVCLRAARQTNKASEAKSMASAKTRAAVVSIAGDDRRLAAAIDQWDCDKWLLNTPGGVIDLRTGKMQPHRPNDYMTKVTAVTPQGDCPKWKGFLRTVTDGDDELTTYIRRVLGYGLTGVTNEHALFFLYGTGANGKGVLINTVAGILADYHKTASQETFTATLGEQHSTDLAMLRGARLVTVTETEAGKRWAESRIKTLTGGDPIVARFMRQDFFEYMPQFKLVISGNHRPGLNSVNEAIRRRVNMLPFNVTIAEEQRDKDLTEKLKMEWPGILAWMIEGCLEWQRVGLQPPKIVTDATDDYLETEDKLGRWIAECLERDPNGWASSSDLFYSWTSWAEENNEWVGSQTKFSIVLKEAGFKQVRRKEGNGFAGLKVPTITPFEELKRGWAMRRRDRMMEGLEGWPLITA
jgi:putative DNA primase/helicase